jgi:hypothetical protein
MRSKADVAKAIAAVVKPSTTDWKPFDGASDEKASSTKGFVVVVDGHFKSEFDTVDAASASGRNLNSTYSMLQIEIYDTATKARTLLSQET